MTTIVDEFRDVVGRDARCKYREKKQIGSGSFAVVYQLVEVATDKFFVGKFMDLSKMTEKNKRFARGEADNVAKCHHPNIIKYIEKFERSDKLLLIFEFADGGDLAGQVQHRSLGGRSFKEQEILIIFTQLALSLYYLHSRNMMHRDLKTPNVLLTTSGLIKLSDFGFSREYEGNLSTDVGTTFCGTPYYLAPELWNQAPYSAKADVWSFGVILYELMTLRKPFTASTMKDLVDRVVSGKFDPLPSNFSPDLVAICNSMLMVDSTKRPSIKGILQKPIVRKLGLNNLRVMVPKLTSIPEETRTELVNLIDDLLREPEVA